MFTGAMEYEVNGRAVGWIRTSSRLRCGRFKVEVIVEVH
jgi:hypothetical protein